MTSAITDYHLHLRGDDLSARAADHFNSGNIARYVEAAEAAGVTELGCAEHMYRFTEALNVWQHPFWNEWAIDDIDQYVEAVEASPIKLGIEGDYILGAEEKLVHDLGWKPGSGRNLASLLRDPGECRPVRSFRHPRSPGPGQGLGPGGPAAVGRSAEYVRARN